MSDAPDNQVLVYLRRLDEKMDRVAEGMRDLKHRVTAVERQLGEVFVGMAALHARMDRVDSRLERIERRLDLADAPR